MAEASDSVSDSDSDRSSVSRSSSILGWVGLVRSGAGASGMVALRSVSLDGGSEAEAVGRDEVVVVGGC